MSEHDTEPGPGLPQTGVNPQYAAGQLAKALRALEQGDPATRARAQAKLARWEAVISNLLSGSVEYGTRAPVKGVPAWATLEVATGGFATGELLAGGPLQQHERVLLSELRSAEQDAQRRVLNGYFLSDAGLQDLQQRLNRGHYEINVPEEAALMVVAWLVEQGHTDAARELVETVGEYFDRLRFYPVPSAKARLPSDSRLHLKTVAATIADIEIVRQNSLIRAQKEAVEIWAPLYDQMIALFIETVSAGEPCAQFPSGWAQRAAVLLQDHARLRALHRWCSRFERPKTHYAQVRELLQQAAFRPRSLTRRNLGRLRTILDRYIVKHGLPDSAECAAQRSRQRAAVAGPTHQAIANIVVHRLRQYPADEGIDAVETLHSPITASEADEFHVPEGTSVPKNTARKVERCLNETAAVLIERGLITSGEVLAHLLPQFTAGLRALGLASPALRGLYAATYQAFRRRRSLLLLNLETQVRLEELPWVAAMERFRQRAANEREIAKQALEDVAAIAFCAFPHVILPNKLLQELRALAKDTGLDLPLVDELAADIFMGQLTPKFLAAAQIATRLLDGSLYAIYYGIDCARILAMQLPIEPAEKPRFSWRLKSSAGELVSHCAQRAGVERCGRGEVAHNGMVIEQQQILTTQNLAALFVALDLRSRLAAHLPDMARRCFEWVCERQQVPSDDHHTQLIVLKNTAYAWRQMIFYLSLQDRSCLSEFVSWAKGHLAQQGPEFRARFAPALRGLEDATRGQSPESAGGRRFQGWTSTRHWLMPENVQRK